MAVGVNKRQRCVTFDQAVDQELAEIAKTLEVSVGALVRDAVRHRMGSLRTRAARARDERAERGESAAAA